MTGIPVDHIRSTSDGKLLIHDPKGWHRFNERDTVFADAEALGYRTSVVGWFNPYCRILSAVLDSCFWTNHSILGGFLPDRGIASNLIYPVLDFIERTPAYFGRHSQMTPDEIEEGKDHISDFVDLDHAADAALSDPRNSFIFIHMPVPHPDGMWDRHSGHFAIDHSNYVDNLVLADAYLGHVQRLLEATGQWDSTTVVIMGDHSWRTQLLWKRSPAWSPDDQIASEGGLYDPRPAYLIKLPYQRSPDIIPTAFSAVRTRSLLDQLILDRITTPDQLQQWIVGPPRDTRMSRWNSFRGRRSENANGSGTAIS